MPLGLRVCVPEREGVAEADAVSLGDRAWVADPDELGVGLELGEALGETDELGEAAWLPVSVGEPLDEGEAACVPLAACVALSVALPEPEGVCA